MHPLNTALEDLPHEQHIQKRRSSIDNSLLAPGRSSRLLADADDEEDCNRPRRLSLDNHTRITISFLASSHLKRTYGDLDMDYHKSEHASGDAKKLSSTGTTAEDVSDRDDSTLSYDDCDSFCDASVQQEADKEYLRRDLGASCIWDDTTTVDTGLVEELEEMSLDSVPEDICEVDEEDEDADDDKKKPPVTESGASNPEEQGTVAVLKRAKRRSFTKRIPRILFRSKSPKILIRKKSATQEQVEQV